MYSSSMGKDGAENNAFSLVGVSAPGGRGLGNRGPTSRVFVARYMEWIVDLTALLVRCDCPTSLEGLTLFYLSM